MKSGINKINSLLGLTVFLAALLPGGQASMKSVSFDHLSLNQGLSQASVYCILQDRKGFIRFGTQDGLNKYDGYTFKVYRTDDDNPNSRSDIYINTLFEDGGGLPELFNKEGEMFGYGRVSELFKTAGSRPVNEITAFLKDAGDQWLDGKDPDDAITFVVIKVTK